MKITIETPKGISPKVAPDDLLNDAAQTAENCKLEKGDFRAWNRPGKLTGLALTSVAGLFKWTANDTDYWAESANDLDYVRTPIANDSYERMYFTGETEMRGLANDNISDPFKLSTDYYKVGVPAPESAPTVASGGSVTRYYVGCYVTAYGEEGLPSAIGGGTNVAASPVGISGLTDVSDDTEGDYANRRITTYRLYRTASGTAGTAEFLKVLDATWFNETTDYAVGDYVIYSETLYKCSTIHPAGAWDAGHFTAGDDVDDEDLSAVVCPSTTWEVPMTGMKGLGVLPSGALFGFHANELCFSVPNRPHAWPSGYRMSFPFDVVATKACGSSVIVLTKGNPYIVYGTHPENMQKKQIDAFYPCISKRSAVSAQEGVFYLSKEGLIRIASDGSASNVTFEILNPSDWKEYHPTTMHGAFYHDKYFGFYKSGADEGGIVIDFGNKILSTLTIYAYACHVTAEDADFYLAMQDEIDEDNPPETIPLCVKEWEGDDYNYLAAKWKSKKFTLDSGINFSAARIIMDSEFYNTVLALVESDAYIADYNADLFAAGNLGGAYNEFEYNRFPYNGDLLMSANNVEISSLITFKLYVDGVLKFTKLVSDEKPFRLPSGFRGMKWEVQLEGNIPVRRVQIATSARELLNG